jgi:hypothetical protein
MGKAKPNSLAVAGEAHRLPGTTGTGMAFAISQDNPSANVRSVLDVGKDGEGGSRPPSRRPGGQRSMAVAGEARHSPGTIGTGTASATSRDDPFGRVEEQAGSGTMLRNRSHDLTIGDRSIDRDWEADGR